MTASSTSMVCAAPAGPFKCYRWHHEGRSPALLFRNEAVPSHVLFRSYAANGDVLSDSGWHGISFKEECTRAMQYTTHTGRFKTQRRGDRRFTLERFCYAGMDHERTHAIMVFEKAVDVDDNTWRLKSCSCGTKHSISLIYNYMGVDWEDPDVTSVPSDVQNTCYELQCP